MAYTLVQIAFSIHYICTDNHITTENGILTFDFYGDKIVSYILATGAGATFGVTRDVKSVVEALGDTEEKFFDKAYACGSLILIAFVCTAMLSVYSSYSLPKRI
ncbi:hypothetical protein LWI28_002752 [Acer negundo]|uniref:CASP-like protein n=1 Tax=Acer negundo TaxID=4023 RepID=A0AAD5I904_ACENE|nr:hypothetical protein LWI28_002752 [Acer negundo]